MAEVFTSRRVQFTALRWQQATANGSK